MKVVYNGYNIRYANTSDEVDAIVREVLSPHQDLRPRKIIDDTTLVYRLIVYEWKSYK